MSPFLTVTVATGRGSLTFTNPTQASKFVEFLTSTGQNAVITWRHGDHIEQRAVVHGVAHSDLAIQRLEIETVMDPDSQSALVLICRSLRMEGPSALDFICSGCGASDWWVAILEQEADIVRRLRTCRSCRHQLRTRELRKAMVEV